MVVTHTIFFINNLSSHLYRLKTNNTNKILVTFASKKHILDQKSFTPKKHKQLIGFSLKVPNTILVRSVVAVLGLGFIDAGYSGDWSRIGVISKETEDLLKLAAFIVVPLCLILIFSISKEEKKEKI